MRHRLLLLIPALLLCSCLAEKSEPKVVILKHPDTLDFQRCVVADWGSKQGYRDNEECIRQYRQRGYIVWGSH